MIKIDKISKSFGDLTALNNVSLRIKPGEIFGLLGPNGAGKSTTINIVSTILEPDQGEIVFDGKRLSENKEYCKAQIGIVPQEISLYDDLSAVDNLQFWGELYNLPSKVLKEEIDKVLDLVGLYDRRKDLIKTYSGGMKRRINIAASILHKPKILLMDEPTVGIDPQSRNRIFEVVKQLNENGMTIIYTTHYMEEAEKLCDKIAIIDLGKIVAEGSLQELKEYGNAFDLLNIKTSETTKSYASDISFQNISNIQFEDHQITIQCKNIGEELPKIVSELNSKNINITGIESKTSSLETVFLNLTGKHLRD